MVGFSCRLVDYSEMTIAERNVIFVENKTKIDRGRMFFLFYDVERDKKWIEENIISQE